MKCDKKQYFFMGLTVQSIPNHPMAQRASAGNYLLPQ